MECSVKVAPNLIILDNNPGIDDVTLPVGHHRVGVGLLEGDTGVVLLQVVQADLQMELAGAGDDVFAGLLDHALHHGVGLGEPLEALDQLGEVGGVPGLDGHAHHGRDRELHLLHVVRLLKGGDNDSNEVHECLLLPPLLVRGPHRHGHVQGQHCSSRDLKWILDTSRVKRIRTSSNVTRRFDHKR